MSESAQRSEITPTRASVKRKAFAILLLLAVLAPMPWLARRGASRLEFFRVRAVEVRGVRYLAPETVVGALGLDTMRSVWDDTAPLIAKLVVLPQIGAADVSRKLPGTLLVEIRENLPVALAPGANGLQPVDSGGTILPIDLATETLDLPVANQRDVPLLALLGAVRADQPALYRRISEISRDGRRDIVLGLVPLDGTTTGSHPGPAAADSGGRLSSPTMAPSLRVRAQLGVSAARLADIFPVESDLQRRRAGESIVELDLRYRDQVIARLQ